MRTAKMGNFSTAIGQGRCDEYKRNEDFQEFQGLTVLAVDDWPRIDEEDTANKGSCSCAPPPFESTSSGLDP